MANFNAVDLFSKHVQTSHEGNQVVSHGSITPTAGASGDTYKVCKIPPGVEAFRLTIKSGDLDTNVSPTIACKIGYAPVDGSAGDDDAFVATGSTILQAASAVTGNVFVVKPVRIEKESFLVITLTAAAATFAAAEITAIVESAGLGAK